KRVHARLQRAMHPSVSKSGSPLPRGRTENVAPSVFIVQLSKSGWEWKKAKGNQPPVSASGQGIALIPLITPPSLRGGWRADKAHGLERQAGDGTACGRALGVKRHAPRLAARQRRIFCLRLRQRLSRT